MKNSIIVQIQKIQAISKLPATEKSKKQTEIVNAGLPKAYQKLTDMNDLKKYYEIVAA